MAKVFIEGVSHEMDPEKNLLQECLSLGFDLPYFCWHPALGSVGACRQCAVKQFRDEQDTRGRLVMACMTPALEGTRISIADPEAKTFRATVVESLMINHPHDCPVCDEGGECHLQDMTVMTGHTYRKTRFKKRTFRNQNLGPLINHEMNRCIQCYRCVRYYRDYAGGTDLNAFASRNHVYFGRHENGVLESEFSGNLVEVCPTGVFTDKTLKAHYTRKWDLQMAPSLCTHCGLGCNITPGERYGKLRRIVNRYHHEINGYFLCDRGRFGYEFVNADHRLRYVYIRRRRQDAKQAVNRSAGLEYISSIIGARVAPSIGRADEASPSRRFAAEERKRVIGFGSPPASLEANFALRSLVGKDNFYSGESDLAFQSTRRVLEILAHHPARVPSLLDVEQSDAVFILGEDISNSAPRMALAVRQASLNEPRQQAQELKIPLWHDTAVREVIQNKRGAIFIASPFPTRLDELSSKTLRATPSELARTGFALAHAISEKAPKVSNLSRDDQVWVEKVAATLQTAKRVTVIAGTSLGDDSLLEAAASVAAALMERGCASTQLSLIVPECNSLGLAMMQPRPFKEAFSAAGRGEVESAVILENDLYRRRPTEEIDSLFEKIPRVILVDHLAHKTAERADIVLPAGTFAESDGTFVNIEGRAQRFFQVFVPEGDVQESWRWLGDLRKEERGWKNLDAVLAALSREFPDLRGAAEAAHHADFRMPGGKIPRQPARYSGRTAMWANVSVSEPGPPPDPDSPLVFSMEGSKQAPPVELIPFFWAPGWNSIQSVNKFQEEVGGPLRENGSGVCLFQAKKSESWNYFSKIPQKMSRKDGEFLALPMVSIFGSEELSGQSPAIVARSEAPAAWLNEGDGRKFEKTSNQPIRVMHNGRRVELAWKVDARIPKGVIGIPTGFPGSEYLELPAIVRLET